MSSEAINQLLGLVVANAERSNPAYVSAEGLENLLQLLRKLVASENVSEWMKEDFLKMLNRYFYFLNKGELNKAQLTLDNFVNCYPDGESLGVLWLIGWCVTVLLSLAIALCPIPIVASAGSVWIILFLASIPASIVAYNCVTDTVENCISGAERGSAKRHDVATSIWAAVERLGIFSESTVQAQSDERNFVPEQGIGVY